jgi:glycosyltransferase involved in cell wall biosynthesis
MTNGPMSAPVPARAQPLLLVAHPSPDVYGSDLQLVETVRAAVGAGWRVTVVLPADGPLVGLLSSAGARVDVLEFPVLRKSLLHPVRLVGFALRTLRSTATLVRRLRRARPDALLVNTVTIPHWLVAGRLAGTPTLCHVHEAEDSHPVPVRIALAAPLLLARSVITNSAAARTAVVSVLPRLAGRTQVVHNGVGGPAAAPGPPVPASPRRIVLVGRLSPRKGTDVALAAVEQLLVDGLDVELVLCGSVFAGYEWFEQELRDRVEHGPAHGRVTFAGYVSPTWPELEAAAVVVVPSRFEPFGNAAVEALLAQRPVVASDVQGLREVIKDGETGVLVPAGDASALASAVRDLLDDDERAGRIARAGRADALDRFSLERYNAAMVAAIGAVTTR